MGAREILMSNKMNIELAEGVKPESAAAYLGIMSIKGISVIAMSSVIAMAILASGKPETVVTVHELPPFDLLAELSDKDLMDMASIDYKSQTYQIK